jgi:cardiolipin synthase
VGATPPDRLWTWPNALSALRLAGVPLFLYLLLVPRADTAALVVLVASGLTDWLDGKLARWLDQTSRVGALLDPAADRLYILAALIAFVVRGVVPLWLAVPLVVRDVVLGCCLLLARRRGMAVPEVHYLGKAATFCLLYAFPLLLVAATDESWARPVAPVAEVFGYAIAGWGVGLYLWSGVLYAIQVSRATGGGGPPGGRSPALTGNRE